MDSLQEINCKEIFKKAYENRYTWKNDFYGYQGKCIFLTNNIIYKGDFVLGKDFKPNIQKIEDEKVVKNITSQLFEVCIHRIKREFESVHSENDFKGYKGNCIFLSNNNTHKGNFVLGKDFKPNIQKIEDEKVLKSIASQLFEVCIHLSLIHI